MEPTLRREIKTIKVQFVKFDLIFFNFQLIGEKKDTAGKCIKVRSRSTVSAERRTVLIHTQCVDGSRVSSCTTVFLREGCCGRSSRMTARMFKETNEEEARCPNLDPSYPRLNMQATVVDRQAQLWRGGKAEDKTLQSLMLLFEKTPNFLHA